MTAGVDPLGRADRRLPRRQFLGRSGAALAGGVLAAGGLTACADDGASGAPTTPRANGPAAGTGSVLHSFRGLHQAGVTAGPAAAGLVAGLDLRVDDRAELRELFATLTDTIEHVMAGEPWETRAGGFPPYDTGMLGPAPGPTGTSVIVGLGDSLFLHPELGDRFELAAHRPLELQPMPIFRNDQLVTPERSHGDLSVVVQADDSEAAIHAMRQILRVTRGRLVPRWSREGFQRLIPDRRPGEAPGRNLLGFKDGTANPDPGDDAAMNRVVWVQAGDGQPDWAVGGTYQAIRVIRMLVEFWDRTRLSEQEAIFHRRRDSGAPIGMEHETDLPAFPDDLAMDSHIARANPRTPGSDANLMLRRGLNYTGGVDANLQLDQGLIFTSYQRSLEAGFLTVQRRLDGEALEEYIRPVGGGFFFVPPAPAAGEILAERLLDA